MKNYSLNELTEYANNYRYKESELPIQFNDDKYVRNTIYKDEFLEIVVICFSAGQTSSVHSHQGSNCVIRIVKGKMLEQLFRDNGKYLEFVSNHYLNVGDVSGLGGTDIHQVSCIDKNGSVLLNFYSPPFKV